MPETYVIDRDGHIAFRQVGPITPEVLKEKILPLITSLRRSGTGPTATVVGSQPSSEGKRAR